MARYDQREGEPPAGFRKNAKLSGSSTFKEPSSRLQIIDYNYDTFSQVFYYTPAAYRRPNGLELYVKSVDEFMGIPRFAEMLDGLCTTEKFKNGQAKLGIEKWFKQELGCDLHKEQTITDYKSLERFANIDGKALFTFTTYRGRQYGVTTTEPNVEVSASFFEIAELRKQVRQERSTHGPRTITAQDFRAYVKSKLLRILDRPKNSLERRLVAIIKESLYPEDFLSVILGQYKLAYLANCTIRTLLETLPAEYIKVIQTNELTLSSLLHQVEQHTLLSVEYMVDKMNILYDKTIKYEGNFSSMRKQLLASCREVMRVHKALPSEFGPELMAVHKNFKLAEDWITCCQYLFKNLEAYAPRFFFLPSFSEFYAKERSRACGWTFLEEIHDFVESHCDRAWLYEPTKDIEDYKSMAPPSLIRKVQRILEGPISRLNLNKQEAMILENPLLSNNSMLQQAREWYQPRYGFTYGILNADLSSEISTVEPANTMDDKQNSHLNSLISYEKKGPRNERRDKSKTNIVEDDLLFSQLSLTDGEFSGSSDLATPTIPSKSIHSIQPDMTFNNIKDQQGLQPEESAEKTDTTSLNTTDDIIESKFSGVNAIPADLEEDDDEFALKALVERLALDYHIESKLRACSFSSSSGKRTELKSNSLT